MVWSVNVSIAPARVDEVLDGLTLQSREALRTVRKSTVLQEHHGARPLGVCACVYRFCLSVSLIMSLFLHTIVDAQVAASALFGFCDELGGLTEPAPSYANRQVH